MPDDVPGERIKASVMNFSTVVWICIEGIRKKKVIETQMFFHYVGEFIRREIMKTGNLEPFFTLWSEIVYSKRLMLSNNEDVLVQILLIHVLCYDSNYDVLS